MKLIVITFFIGLFSMASHAQIEREEFRYLASEIAVLNHFTMNQLNDSLTMNQPRRTCHLWGQLENSVARLDVVATRLNNSIPDELDLNRHLQALQMELIMSLKARFDGYCFRNQNLETRFLSTTLVRMKTRLNQIENLLLKLSQQ